MRAALIGTVLVGIAIGFLAPNPFTSVTGMTPAPDLPTFEETRERIGQPEPPPPPETGENPERRALRKAVLHAARQLEFNPCNKDLRRKLVVAIKPFAEASRKGPPEYVIVDGRKQNASDQYDKPAGQAILKALLEGHLDPRDLATSPLARKFLKVQAGGFPGKVRCDG